MGACGSNEKGAKSSSHPTAAPPPEQEELKTPVAKRPVIGIAPYPPGEWTMWPAFHLEYFISPPDYYVMQFRQAASGMGGGFALIRGLHKGHGVNARVETVGQEPLFVFHCTEPGVGIIFDGEGEYVPKGELTAQPDPASPGGRPHPLPGLRPVASVEVVQLDAQTSVINVEIDGYRRGHMWWTDNKQALQIAAYPPPYPKATAPITRPDINDTCHHYQVVSPQSMGGSAQDNFGKGIFDIKTTVPSKRYGPPEPVQVSKIRPQLDRSLGVHVMFRFDALLLAALLGARLLVQG
eukprot:Hpha_TRINITY_DN11442_c0_g3::TRINITY_DN11442_c0_g3_i1::g.137641::m.137641